MRPQGTLYRLAPGEMHFVDCDYAMVMGESAPEVTDRIFQIDSSLPVPTRGPVSTNLDRKVFEPGEVIFRPGDPMGQYYVVVEGEVEIRGEGYGADQTVVRVGTGQLFGDGAVLRGQRGALTAHAVTRTELLAVRRESMRDLLLPTEPD